MEVAQKNKKQLNFRKKLFIVLILGLSFIWVAQSIFRLSNLVENDLLLTFSWATISLLGMVGYIQNLDKFSEFLNKFLK